jgi:hypothetical protein
LRRKLEDEATTGFSDVPYNKNWLYELAARAPIYARLGLLEPAAVLYDLLAPWSSQVIFNGSAVTGSVARLVGVLAALLGRWRQADDFFEEAVACHRRMNAPVFLARTQVDWARMLLDQAGDRDAGHHLAGDHQAGDHQAGHRQAGHHQAGHHQAEDQGAGQRARAQGLLIEALGISQEIGLGPVERRARQQLARLPA